MTTLSDIISAITKVCPNATLGDDSDGQIVIHTNMREVCGGPNNGECVEMEEVKEGIPHKCVTCARVILWADKQCYGCKTKHK